MGERDGTTAEKTAREGTAREEVATRDEAKRHTHDSVVHPDTPETMQEDHDAAPGRQSYADARASDYGGDFRAEESGAHPVKPVDEDALDEDGIPEIAQTEPPDERDG